jgi:DNA end-binding protein Ku
MAARPTWSGQLRISLVSFPVRLFPATESGREIAFHQIHKPSGKRIKQQLIVPDIGPVSRDEIVKGYEYKRGKYVTFEPGELDEVRKPQKHTLDMVQFVGAEEIDPIYFDRPYYLVPDNYAAHEPFAVVRDALCQERKIGLAQIVFTGREHLAAIRPCGRGMVLETLRYGDEVRKASPYFEEIGKIEVADDQLQLAKELIRRKTAKFDPGKFHDTYAEAVKRMIEARVSGESMPESEPEPTTNVISFMDALKRSVAEAGKSDIAPRPAARKPGKKEPGKRRKAG